MSASVSFGNFFNRDTAITGADMVLGVGSALIAPRLGMGFIPPTSGVSILFGSIAAGAVLSAGRSILISTARYSAEDKPFDGWEFAEDLGVAVVEGALTGAASVCAATGAYRAFTLNNRLLAKSLDILIGDAATGAAVGGLHYYFDDQSVVQGAMGGAVAGLFMRGVFSMISNGAYAAGRRIIGETLVHRFSPALAAQDPHELFSRYPQQIREQIEGGERLSGQIRELSIGTYLDDMQALARAIDPELQAMRRRCGDYYRIATENGRAPQLLISDCSTLLRERAMDQPLVVVSGMAKNMKSNNSEIGHNANDDVLEATFRAYNAQLDRLLGRHPQLVSGVALPGRVNPTFLLDGLRLKKISEHGVDIRNKQALAEWIEAHFGHQAMQPVVEGELGKMAIQSPRLRVDRDQVVWLKTDLGSQGKGEWVRASDHLLSMHLGVADLTDAASFLRAHSTDHSAWAALRRKHRGSGEFREADVYRFSNVLLMSSLNRARVAQNSDIPIEWATAPTLDFGKDLLPLGRYLEDSHIRLTLGYIVRTKYDQWAARADDPDLKSFHRLIGAFLREKGMTITEEAYIRRLRSCLRRPGEEEAHRLIHDFVEYLDKGYKSLQIEQPSPFYWFAVKAGGITVNVHPVVPYVGEKGFFDWAQQLLDAVRAGRMDEFDRLRIYWHQAAPGMRESYQEMVERLPRRMESAMADARNPLNIHYREFWINKVMGMVKGTDGDAAVFAAGDESVAALRSGHGTWRSKILFEGVEGDNVRSYNGRFRSPTAVYDPLLQLQRMVHDLLRKRRIHGKPIPSSLAELDHGLGKIMRNTFKDAVPVYTSQNGVRTLDVDDNGDVKMQSLWYTGIVGEVRVKDLWWLGTDIQIRSHVREIFLKILGGLDSVKGTMLGNGLFRKRITAKGHSSVVDLYELERIKDREAFRYLPKKKKGNGVIEPAAEYWQARDSLP